MSFLFKRKKKGNPEHRICKYKLVGVFTGEVVVVEHTVIEFTSAPAGFHAFVI